MVRNLPFKKKIGIFFFLMLGAFVAHVGQAVVSYNTNKAVWYYDRLTRNTSILIYDIRQYYGRVSAGVEFFIRTKDSKAGENVLILLEEIFLRLSELAQLKVLASNESGEHLNQYITTQFGLFEQIQKKYLEIGLNENSGEHGRIREGIHQVEALLTEKKQFEMLASMLQLRRHEKDFMSRSNISYLEKFTGEMDWFYKLINDTNVFSKEEKEHIHDLTTQYAQGFYTIASELLAVTKLIDTFRDGTVEVNEAMDGLMAALEVVYKTHDSMQSNLMFDQFLRSQITILLILLLIGGLLAWFQYDIMQAVDGLSAIARKVANGEDHEIVVDRHDEVGGLAHSLKVMKASLTKRHQELLVKVVELEESEKKYVAVIQLAGDPIVSLNEELRIFAWNQGAKSCFGYDAAEINGLSFADLVASANHLSMEHAFKSILLDGKSRVLGEDGQFLCQRSHGELFPVTLSLSTWEMEGKHYFTLILRDISDRIAGRRQIERALDLRTAIADILQQSLESLTLREILSRSLEIVLAIPWLGVEQRGAIFLYDEQTERLEMVVQKSLSSELLVLCKTIPLGHCLCGQAAQSGEVVMSNALDDRHSITFPGISQHGHYCVPIFTNQKRLGVLNVYLPAGYAFDKEEVVFLKSIANTLAGLITRRQAEHKIMQLSRAMEQSPVAIIITDRHGYVEYVNPRFSIQTDYFHAEVVGKSVIGLKTVDGSPEQQALQNIMTAGGEWSGQLHSRRKGGDFFWEFASFSPVLGMDAQITNYLLISEDITEKKALEEVRDQLLTTLDAKVIERTLELKYKIQELENTRYELIESEKMASLGRLVAGIAHEVNTPIGVAYSASTQLMEESQTIETMLGNEEVDLDDLLFSVGVVKEASTLVARNLQRAAELIQSFKRASIDHSSEAVRVYRVMEVVNDVQMSLRNQFKKTAIEIDVECAQELQVVGIPGYLTQILTNFMLNSLHHGFADGLMSGRISMRFASDGKQMDFIYSDTGIGMTEETKNQAFEPFYTTNRGAGGSGLGLYICYNLITTKLRGTISLSSMQNKGVQFTCNWPIDIKV